MKNCLSARRDIRTAREENVRRLEGVLKRCTWSTLFSTLRGNTSTFPSPIDIWNTTQHSTPLPPTLGTDFTSICVLPNKRKSFDRCWAPQGRRLYSNCFTVTQREKRSTREESYEATHLEKFERKTRWPCLCGTAILDLFSRLSARVWQRRIKRRRNVHNPRVDARPCIRLLRKWK